VQELETFAHLTRRQDADFFAAIPPRAAVFLIEPRAELSGAQPYLLRTANLRQRLMRLLGRRRAIQSG